MLHQILTYCLIFVSSLLIGQSNNLLNKQVDLSSLSSNNTIEEALNYIESKYKISFSYSSNQFNKKSGINIPEVRFTSLEKALNYVFYRYNINLNSTANNKIVLTASLKKIRVFGYIRDASSRETIPGPIIINQKSSEIHSPNGDGYYSFTIQKDTVQLETRLLGYFPDTTTIMHDGIDIRKDITLRFNNQISPVIIRNTVAENLLLDPGNSIIDPNQNYGNKGITGENDLVNVIRNEPGIASGSEGMIGLNVNGGESDQNLILLDKMPLYETSHVAGINSIFLEESIKSVDMTRTAIPARYGGRLSSVVNISLKEGHKERPKRSVSIGFMNARFGLEGPFNKTQNTTFNLSGRTSLINYFINPIVNRFTTFEDINLSYNDVIGKITHRFNNNSKLSLTGYFGGDRTKLVQNDTIITESFYYQKRDINEIKWGNSMLNANYHNILSSKATFHLQAGWTKYNYTSRGYYELESRSNTVDIDRSFDVRTYSSINDYQLTSEVDYYYNDFIKAKVGVAAINHQFSPTVQQSLLKLPTEESTFENPDSIISAFETSAYGELNIEIGKLLFLYPGLHINNFKVENTNHTTFQPRIRALIIPNKGTVISFSYSRMAQNVHLLSNPGIGLASDLWVPSTSAIKPTTNDQVDLEFKQTITPGINISASWYNKKYGNLLSYFQPIDLHANIVVENDIRIFYNNESDWRNEVVAGSGRSNGYTIGLKKETGKFKGWFTYHHNTSTRNFEDLNEGQTFSAKNERPHDINIALSYEISPRLVIGSNWVYTSGGLFSLPNEQFTSSIGIELLRPDGRNNNRLPAFHQLSFTGEYSFTMLGTNTHLNFGMYNLYNRQNPFYLYTTNNPNSEVPIVRKVSIFPIMPFANLTWRW